MMHTSRLYAMLALLGLAGVGPAAAQTTTCDCAELFAWTAGYLERNYPGFRDKVTPATRAEHDALRERLARAAATPADGDACQPILDAYVAWFRDPHMSMFRLGQDGRPSDPDAIRARFADWPSRAVSEAEVRERTAQDPPAGDALDGIWEIAGANYRLAMVPGEAPGSWEAVVLEADGVWWTPGQVKGRFRRTAEGEFEAETFLGNHDAVHHTARLRNGVLRLAAGGVWVRTWPDNPSGYDRARYRASANRSLAVRQLDDRTMLVQIPSFDGSLAERIDSLVEANWARLTATPDLIIDVRGNRGGADRSFQALRPLLYTGPVVKEGLAVYATEENVNAVLAFAQEFRMPADMRAQVDSLVARMRARLGELLVSPPDTATLDSVLPLPQRIAVLTDRFCASSCEAFIQVALQSDKVTVYGDNTGGYLDYGHVMPVRTPCPAFDLNMPIARANHLRKRAYDNVGIPPEVRVPDDVVYWLEWVHEWLRGEGTP
jgi:hypothetical protein